MSPLEGESNNSQSGLEITGSNQNLNKTLSSTDIGENNSLAKVRDILVGNQMREVEKRFTRLEERLARECADLREETRKRLDFLETYIKQEVESLAERIKNEQVERSESLKRLEEDNRNMNVSLEKRMAQLEGQATNNQRELREQILNQSKNLQDDIRQKYDEILAILQREFQELQVEKADRASLASLFSELAIRLNSQS
ncbi:MAG: hypothetical protein SAK29_36585 [Scytonema sp. PMC 1069.18]|nr:hypothetical protein [Scytonema sp. PMC 1069.18]MEC4885515.1 hypothetical protein [Scytonema sp. PMC 1070.18]